MTVFDRLAHALVAPFARAIADRDLPQLTALQADEAIEFVGDRVAAMPSLPRIASLTLCAVLDPLMATPLRRGIVDLAARRSPPGLGELHKLVRGLLVAYTAESAAGPLERTSR